MSHRRRPSFSCNIAASNAISLIVFTQFWLFSYWNFFFTSFSALFLPTAYTQHICYVNFTKFNQPTPIYVNMVRDPVERIISWFYYIRSPWYVTRKVFLFPIFRIERTFQYPFQPSFFTPKVLRRQKSRLSRAAASQHSVVAQGFRDVCFERGSRVHLHPRRNTWRHRRPSTTNAFLLWPWSRVQVS